MGRLLLTIALTVLPAWALATELNTDCHGCVSLRDFGNFGAAQLYRASGIAAPAVGNDRIWVVNPNTGRRVFVDIDTPMTTVSLFGFDVPVPNVTLVEINATWGDGSATEVWTLPVEILASIAASVEVAETDATPEVTEEELPELPGFDPSVLWALTTIQDGISQIVWGGVWRYSSIWFAGVPVITISMCAVSFCY